MQLGAFVYNSIMPLVTLFWSQVIALSKSFQWYAFYLVDAQKEAKALPFGPVT
jgi:hypothetical protein